MLNNATRRDLLNRSRASQFPGSIVEVYRAAEQGIDLLADHEAQIQAQQQEMQVAQTQQQQETGLREEHAQGNTGASMAFPNVQPNQSFNTVGMKAPIDIQKVDNQGHLVESYKNVPPGIEDLPTGPYEGTVIESPAAYQAGGMRMIDPNAGEGSGDAKVGRKKQSDIDYSKGEKKVTEAASQTQDVLNFAPGIGEVIDAKNTLKSLSKGKYGEAALHAAGFMIPFIPGGVIKKGYKALFPGTNKAKKLKPKYAKPTIDDFGRQVNTDPIRSTGDDIIDNRLLDTQIDPDLTYRKSAATRTHPVREGHAFSDIAEEYTWLDKASQTNPHVIKPFNPRFSADGMHSFDLEKLTDYENLSQFRADYMRSNMKKWKGVEKDLFKKNLTKTVQDLNSKGFHHLDLHTGNIMVKGNKKTGKILDFKLIDPVGFTSDFKNVPKFKDFDVKGFQGGDLSRIKDIKYGGFQKGEVYHAGGLYHNINHKKKSGTSRSKSNSTISAKNYANMKSGFKKQAGGLRNHMMEYLHDTGRDTTYVNTVMNAIGQHESKGNPNQVQVSGNKTDGFYDGPGRGSYQYEVGPDRGGNTAINRTANFLKHNTDKNIKDFPNLNTIYNKGNSLDFTNLSKKDQDALFIGDKIFGGVTRRNAFDAVTRNRTTPPSQEETFNYWLNNHKGKINGKRISELTEKEIDIERKKWNSRTKNMFKRGGYEKRYL
tara:strand:- start:1236 stop:3362 length:2127 start_codon:yes stop_codon:yes gene_type:complete